MATPKKQVEQIIAELQALAQMLEGISNLEERSARAKADFESMDSARQRAHDQMQEAQGLLTKAQTDAQRQFELEMFQKQGQLRSLTDRVAALEAQAKDLSNEVVLKGAQLASIINSMNDARRALAG